MSRHPIKFLFACGFVFTLLTSTAMADNDPSASISTFLSRHWQRPLQHQGEAPVSFPALEVSLDPKACGTCHPQQFQDWQKSLHAHAMGPGLLGQLMDMNPDDRAEHQACLHCHAPLAEQADEVVAWLSGGETGPGSPQEEAIPNGPLYNQGLICAGCHLRNFQVRGPHRNMALPPSPPLAKNAHQPHNGWQPQDAFESSVFCAACHQFDTDGYALNGKLLENTFEEWKVSPQAKEGKSCQSCHMPDRRHLWRGIHDKATVLSGVRISLDGVETNNDRVSGILSLTSTEVGHQFPTYVTPRVVMEAIQLDSLNQPISVTRQEQIVARQVSLDLSRELFDTRLAPGETIRLEYQAPRHPETQSILFRVQVEPDTFYRDFYRATLNSGSSDKGAETLRLALQNAEASVYTLFRRKIPLELNSEP